MALYDTLPLYKACYDFLIRVLHTISHFPREYKFTLGENLGKKSFDLVLQVYTVNSAKSKIEPLTDMEKQIQEIYLLLRVCHDMKLMPTEKYAGLVEMIDGIASQTKGWLKSNINKKQDEPVQLSL